MRGNEAIEATTELIAVANTDCSGTGKTNAKGAAHDGKSFAVYLAMNGGGFPVFLPSFFPVFIVVVAGKENHRINRARGSLREVRRRGAFYEGLTR